MNLNTFASGQPYAARLGLVPGLPPLTMPERKLVVSTGLPGRVWIFVRPAERNPYSIVSARGCTEGSEVRGYDLQRLRSQGVCVEVFANSLSYGAETPREPDAAQIPAGHLFAVGEDVFSFDVCETPGSAAMAWLCLAVPASLA